MKIPSDPSNLLAKELIQKTSSKVLLSDFKANRIGIPPYPSFSSSLQGKLWKYLLIHQNGLGKELNLKVKFFVVLKANMIPPYPSNFQESYQFQNFNIPRLLNSFRMIG